ncbi:MAG: CYTH domain-containing protein, partial [Spirochaetota bacterium]
MEGVTSEIEIKARIHSGEGCLEQLAKLSKTGAYDYVDKRDVYYVHRQLDHEESLFRLRQYSDGKAEVTRKQKGFSGDMEVNQEIEYGVSDPKAFRQFCESLGFEVLVEKHKHG